MKKIIVLIIIILSSCNQNNNFVSFKGKVINPNSDSLLIYNNDYKKTIKLNEDNSFSDTLNIKAGKYIIYDGKYAVYVAYEIKKAAMFRFLKKMAKAETQIAPLVRTQVIRMCDDEISRLEE